MRLGWLGDPVFLSVNFGDQITEEMTSVFFSDGTDLGLIADEIFYCLMHLVAESFIMGRDVINDAMIEKCDFCFAQINQNRVVSESEFVIIHIKLGRLI